MSTPECNKSTFFAHYCYVRIAYAIMMIVNEVYIMLNRERLTALRKRAGLIQDDMAKLLNTSRPNYNRYENGNSQPS